HDPAAGLEARGEIGAVPVPNVLAEGRAVGLGVGFHRIVDDGEVGTAAGDRAAHAGGEIGASPGGLPAAGGAVVGGEAVAEVGGVLGHHVADLAPEVLGEVGGVRGGDDVAGGWRVNHQAGNSTEA